MAIESPEPMKAKRGRPRVITPKPGATVATWLTPDEHDKLVRVAQARDVTVSEVLRSLVKSFQK